METRRLVWRFAAFMLFGIVLASVLTFTSCSDDDDEEPAETLAGVYTMTKAILTSDIVDAEDSVIIPSGEDVTAIMAGGIFGASPCQNPVNSAVDMADDGKLYFVCTGTESETQGVDAGSWTENSTLTTITLSLNATVVPPAGFVLSITDITKTGAVLDGKIAAVPLPGDLLGQVPGFEDITFPAIQMVGVDIQFTQVPEPF